MPLSSTRGVGMPGLVAASVISLPSPRVCGGHAAVHVDDVPGGLRRARAREEDDRLGDVLGVDVYAENRAAAVEGGQLTLGHAVRARALGLPLRRPDRGTFNHRVGVDRVHADAVSSAFL